MKKVLLVAALLAGATAVHAEDTVMRQLNVDFTGTTP